MVITLVGPDRAKQIETVTDADAGYLLTTVATK